MTFGSAHSRLTLLLAALALVAAFVAFGWTTLAQAQSEDHNTEEMNVHTPDSDSEMPYDGPTGIWVSGTGLASGTPDIAVISLGVESLEDTAAAARASTATAMQAVITALTEAEVAETDIQTRHFNISPRNQQVQVEKCEYDSDTEKGEGEVPETTVESCYQVWESRMIGYSVSNQASVKIRDLNDVGTIIDGATEAAGDLVRINGISFSIENPQELQDAARANAVADLKRKAEQLAEHSGVELGRLVYLNEGSPYVPPQPLYARTQAAMTDLGVATIISGGELEFSVSLQGVFLIGAEVESDDESDGG